MELASYFNEEAVMEELMLTLHDLFIWKNWILFI